MDRIVVLANIKEAEGFRATVYDDATGRPLKSGDRLVGNATVGWGLTLHEPLSQNVLGIALAERFDAACYDLDANLSGWRSWPHSAGNAIAEMTYNLGWPRLSGFVRLLEACRAGDWQRAAAEVLDSQWAKQVGQRALRIAGQFRAAETE